MPIITIVGFGASAFRVVPVSRNSRAASPCTIRSLLQVLLAAVLWHCAGAHAAGHISLPDNVVPRHYDLAITPHAENMVFTGNVDITIDVIRPTQTLVLNSADLSIDKVSVDGAAIASRALLDTHRQTASFQLAAPLTAGTHTLSMEYTGRIYPHAAGLFALDYDANGGKKRALFTQFENAEARRFLPCWDEPARKATWTLTATVPANLMAVSNMPIASSQSLPDNLVRIRFAETPKMSSYLLFFALGDFERISSKVGGVDIGVIVKRGETARAQFALDAATHLLPYYNEYFGLPYPLPKLDLVAGPGASESFDAMENWGAIFYFESALLMDPKVSTQEDIRNIYVTVAHEMSHQWFGNLVTMEWWDDLWLNEGFASWMQGKAPDHFHPEWDLWLDEQNDLELAMRVDSRRGTHPVLRPILDAQQADEAFDTITYQKGQAIIRMLEQYVGDEAFREAVHNYLQAHAYANATTADLWHEVDKTPASHIGTIARDFTTQAGVPLIRVHIAGNKAHLSVDEFSSDHSAGNSKDWHVPVVTRDVVSSALWRGVVSRGQEAIIDFNAHDALVVNVGQAGYFRTLYEPAAFTPLIEHFQALSPQEQLGLLNDSRALGYSGYAPLSNFLQIASATTAKTNPAVLLTMSGRLRGLDRLYADGDDRKRYRRWAQGLLSPILGNIGLSPINGESHIVALLRSSLIDSLSAFGDTNVIQEARARFGAYQQMPSTLSADRRFNVLSVVATHADAATWDALHQLARTAGSSLEKRQLYPLLGNPIDPELARKALELALTDEAPVTTRPSIIDAVGINHPEMALDFVDKHYDSIAATMEPDGRAEFAPTLVNDSSDTSLIPKLHQFALAHIPVESRQSEIQAEAEIAHYASVRRNGLPEVNRWLANHSGEAGGQTP